MSCQRACWSVVACVLSLFGWLVLDASTGSPLVLAIANNVALKYGLGSLALQKYLEELQVGEKREAAMEALQVLDPSRMGELWNRSHGHTRPVVVAGAIPAGSSAALENWTVGRIAALFPEKSLALETRIDPTQPQGSFAERLYSYEAGNLSQVNQVFYFGWHAQFIERLLNELGPGARAAFRSTGYGHLPGDGFGLIAATINVYRTGAGGLPSGVSWHSHLIESPTTIQITGSKKWRMLGPEFTPQMRADPNWVGAVLFGSYAKYSYSGAYDVIDSEIPMINSLPALEVQMNPGDMLFNPASWWHCTNNPSDDAPTTVISVVFSHASLGSTLIRTYPQLFPFSWLCILVIVLIEIGTAVFSPGGLVAIFVIGAGAAFSRHRRDSCRTAY